ncbi:MAG: leucine-rich repeat protein [Clostridia bacterium]|nr:leucine-rich repeat protein [Clostridia bacterium]
MSTLKKSLSIILAILMLVSSVPAAGLTAFAVEAEEPVFIAEAISDPIVPEGFYLTGRTETDENGKIIWEAESQPSEYGLVNVIWIDVSGNEVQNPDYPLAYPDDDSKEQSDKGDILPSKYDSRELGIITPVEYQVGGTCWAHAGMSVIETAYIKQGLGTTLDLSEYQTAWFGKNGYIEGETDSANDGYVVEDIVADVLDYGGNMNDIEAAMYNFAGGALESKFPLRTEDNNERVGTAQLAEDMKETFTYETKYEQDVILESVKAIPYDISALKQAVMDYGAVRVSYYNDNAYYNSLVGCWNIGDNYPLAYYHPTMNATNHAVTLVGWDDDFSRENFGTYKPEGNGAWLIKNSWSTRWGNYGYFWISYEDKSIQRYDSYVVTVGDPDDYEDVYLYDGLGSKSSLSFIKTAANVFTAENDIYLTKIGHSASGKTSYGLEIYTGLPENCTDPTDGTLALKQSGNTNGEKYIPLNGNVKISKGERFSVVLTMDRIYYEGASSENKKYTSAPGESFYLDGSFEWVDMAGSTYGNAGIRAIAKYQNDSGIYKVSFRDGSKFIQKSTTEDGTVELPEMDGHTYIFTYNGEEFDGTGVTQDITVNAHCYPTNGTVSESNNCITEYKCIYCGEKMKADLTTHSYESEVVAATTKNIGYTKNYCTICGEYDYSDFNILEGAEGAQVDGFWWQFSNGCLSVAGEGKLPDYDDENSAPWKSYNNSIVEVNVIGEITRLGSYFFSNLRKMTTVTLPDTVEEIGERCFYLAVALEKFDCPENLLTIEECAFMNAGFSEFNYNDKIYTIGLYAFMYCSNLTEGVIPATAKNVVRFPYYDCAKLKKITVEEGITYVADLVWSGTPLEELVLPSTVSGGFFANFDKIQKYTVAENNPYYTSVDGVLFNKKMTNLVSYPATKTDKYYKLPESVTSINNYAFGHTSGLKYLDMSDCAVATIKDKTFNQTKSLVNVNLPETLTALWYQCFYKTRISSIYVPSTVTTFQNPPFTTDGDGLYKIPHFYTDSETAKIKEFADANSYECTVLHTEHDFSTEIEDMSEAPTCKDGKSFRTCECGNFEYKSVPATGAHSLVKGETIAPDCDNNGYTVYTCSACGATVNQDEVTALGHDFAWIIDKDATCGADGSKHEKCSRCEAVRNENTVIPATGKHSYTSKVTAPTCTEGGYTTYTCVTCGKTYTANYKDALNHFYNWIIDKDATCAADGVKHEKCTRCDAVRSENTVIPATGKHSYTSEITKPATHLATGVETFTCTVCGDSYTKTIAKLEGHSYNKIVTAPTCTEKGYTTYTCACGDTYKSDEKAALGHSYGWITDKEATCGETGLKHEKCSRCDATRSPDTVIPATGNHSYESEITTESTCTEKGVETFTCTVCGDSYTKPVALKPHTPSEAVEEGRIEPECEVKGSYYKVVYCAECGEELSKVKVEIPALEHMWDNGVINPVSTCKTHGVKTYTCQHNNDHQKSEQVALDSNNHEGGTYLKNQKTESCTVNGYTGDTYCSGCDTMLKSGETITAPGHAWGEWYETKAPTCTVKGEEARSCSVCGNTETREVATTGHSYTAAVTAPTCTKEGYTTYTCACGDSYVADKVASLGHTWGEWYETKAPTCTVKGEEARSCSVCGNTETREVATTGHSYTAAVTAPTCTKEGYTTYTCACGNGYTSDVVPALGHSYGGWAQTKAPTCTVKGEEARSCSACGNTETREVAKTDHSYGEWVVTKAPTCAEKGFMVKTCSVCGANAGSEIMTLNHSLVTTIVPATCTQQGYTNHACANCTYSFNDIYTPAKGHFFVGNDGVCEVCGENVAKDCSCMCHKTGFMGFIYKIISFFWKLFRMNPVCACGMEHY